VVVAAPVPPHVTRTGALASTAEVSPRMTDDSNAQSTPEDAAGAAAEARRVLANKIAELTPFVSDEDAAEVIALLAEAYANLASEPPRLRS
jgi:hypothetical protein